MDDNISRFTQISVILSKSKSTDLEQLEVFEGIYGTEEDDLMMHFYFKGVETPSIKHFRSILADKGISFAEGMVEPTNWNKVWEESFTPVTIENTWHIRAEFHSPDPNIQHEIIISPKMAFGTGHHATTYLVLEQMGKLDLKEKKVLDLGCGSGILAIAAEKLGAASVLAVDYDPLSVENTIENSQLNKCTKIKAEQADVYSFNEGGFDVVLANINKKVLTDTLDKIISFLGLNGTLIISGILDSDANDLLQLLKKNTNYQIHEREGWVSICVIP